MGDATGYPLRKVEAQFRERMAVQPGRVECAICGAAWEGPLDEARADFARHRAEAHSDVPVPKRRRRRLPTAKTQLSAMPDQAHDQAKRNAVASRAESVRRRDAAALAAAGPGQLECRTCGETKPDEAYPNSRGKAESRRGRQGSCRACQRTKWRKAKQPAAN